MKVVSSVAEVLSYRYLFNYAWGTHQGSVAPCSAAARMFRNSAFIAGYSSGFTSCTALFLNMTADLQSCLTSSRSLRVLSTIVHRRSFLSW